MTIFARAAIVMILVATTALMLLLPSTHSVDRSPRTCHSGVPTQLPT
jgi:hypothetical protein